MMRIVRTAIVLALCGLVHSSANANSAFDMPGQILKRPVSGIVNVRKWATPSSQIVGQVTNGTHIMITGGACIHAKTGAEVDITIYKSKLSLYRKLKSPHIFCQVTSPNVDGWIRGTHLMPDGGF